MKSFLLFFFSYCCCRQYDRLWVLISCDSACRAFLSVTRYVQFFTFNLFQPFNTLSPHLFFGRPLDLIPKGFHFAIFLNVFAPRPTPPSTDPVKMSPQFYALCSYVINHISPVINFSSSSLFLILHSSSSHRLLTHAVICLIILIIQAHSCILSPAQRCASH